MSGTGQPCAEASTIIALRNRTRSFAVRLIRCNRCPSTIDNGRTNTSGGRATAILPSPVTRSGPEWTPPTKRSITAPTNIDEALVTTGGATQRHRWALVDTIAVGALYQEAVLESRLDVDGHRVLALGHRDLGLPALGRD